MYLALRYVNYTMNPVRTYLLYIPRDALPAEKFPKIKIQAITDNMDSSLGEFESEYD